MSMVTTGLPSLPHRPRPKDALPGHRQAAAWVALFAAGWTQVLAAVVLALMWFAWQDPLNLAWPDPERLALMGGTLAAVLSVSLVVASRFRRRRAAEREAFREIWYTGGAATGAWYGLPLYMSVTWDHLIYGGHDAATIITVGGMFMLVGGMAGVGLAVFSEPAARWIYERARQRPRPGQGGPGGGLVWFATGLMLVPGALLTLGLLGLGPHPVAPPAYAGAVPVTTTTENYGCLATVASYTVPDQAGKVLAYFRQLAATHRYSAVTLPGRLQPATAGVILPSGWAGADLGAVGVVRYSNSAFQTAAESYTAASDACRSIRVFIQPVATGSLITTIREQPGHVH